MVFAITAIHVENVQRFMFTRSYVEQNILKFVNRPWRASSCWFAFCNPRNPEHDSCTQISTQSNGSSPWTLGHGVLTLPTLPRRGAVVHARQGGSPSTRTETESNMYLKRVQYVPEPIPNLTGLPDLKRRPTCWKFDAEPLPVTRTKTVNPCKVWLTTSNDVI